MTEATEIFKHDTLSGLPWVILEIMERAFLGLSWRALSLVFVQTAWRKLMSWHWRWGQLGGGVVISFRGVGVVGVWGSAGEFGKLRGRKNPLPWRTSVPVPLLCKWFNYDDGDKYNALGWWILTSMASKGWVLTHPCLNCKDSTRYFSHWGSMERGATNLPAPHFSNKQAFPIFLMLMFAGFAL